MLPDHKMENTLQRRKISVQKENFPLIPDGRAQKYKNIGGGGGIEGVVHFFPTEGTSQSFFFI